MKFMKLGSKPDSFKNDGNNVWYVTSELASDVIINVGDSNFYLHKFPLLSKSGRLQKLVGSINEEIDIHEIPGGSAAFEICAKFCYGMAVTLNAHNVVSIYCAADYLEMYETIDKGNLVFKAHPGISKSDKKRICRLMDCKKLSVDACMHAVQNERLPLRVVVQVLFFEQARAATSSGSSTPDLPKSMKALNVSNGKPATNPEDDWDGVATAEELKALKEELAALRMRYHGPKSTVSDKASVPRVKGLLSTKKIFSKIWSSKGGIRENSGSDSSESFGSANLDDAKSTPSRKGRYSVS